MDDLTMLRARADQQVAHVNTHLDKLVDMVRRHLRTTSPTDAAAVQAGAVTRAFGLTSDQRFAGELLAVALVRLAAMESGTPAALRALADKLERHSHGATQLEARGLLAGSVIAREQADELENR
jgi:hypothetical protein